MRVRILSLFVVCILLVLSATPALASDRLPEQKALDAQGLAWRLLINEGGTLRSLPPLALENWQKGQKYLSQGMWPQAQSSFEITSGTLIRQQVEEAWLLKEPVPDYIFSEASLGVVERGWSLKGLATRVSWAGSLAYQTVGDDGEEDNTFYQPDGTVYHGRWASYTDDGKLITWPTESQILVSIDPRSMMRNLNIEVRVTIYGRTSSNVWFNHTSVATAPLIIFWIPNSKGDPVSVWIRSVNAKGESIESGSQFLGPIGPGSVRAVQVTLP